MQRRSFLRAISSIVPAAGLQEILALVGAGDREFG